MSSKVEAPQEITALAVVKKDQPISTENDPASKILNQGAIIAHLFILSLMNRSTLQKETRKSPDIKKNTVAQLMKHNSDPHNEDSIICTAMCTWGHERECINGRHTDGIHQCPGTDYAEGHVF